MDKAEIEASLSRYRNEEFAKLIAIMVGLAAQQNPEHLRTALASVFDLEVVRQQTEKISHEMHMIYSDWMKMKDDLERARLELDASRKEVEGLRHTVLKLRQWLADKVKPIVVKAGARRAGPPPK